MAEKCMFFNSTANDRRKYGAQDMAMYWESFIRSGLIHENREPLLRVQADDATMSLSVENGKAILAGHLYLKEGHVPLTIKQSGATEDRFDRVVLQLSNEPGKEGSRYIRLKIIEGSKEGPPALRREQIEGRILHYELSLAQIHVKAGKSYLEQSDIIDERLDEELCGLASSLVTVPTDIFEQRWNEWFKKIQDSAFVTQEDFLEVVRSLQKENSNLNLQIEASQRVKNGLTFGTNFDTSFGMDIDFSRTITTTVLEVGQTNIHVENIDGFEVGQEVSIYDDVNLERRVIAEINGNNIIVDKPLMKDYKVETNIARSMAVIDVFSKSMKFGVWGMYEPAEINSTFATGGNLVKSNTIDRPFEIANGKMLVVGRRDGQSISIHTKSIDDKNEEAWTEVYQRTLSNYTETRFAFLPYQKSVITFTKYDNASIVIHKVNELGVTTKLGELRATNAFYSLKALEKDGFFYLFYALANQNAPRRQVFMKKYTFDELESLNGDNLTIADPESIVPFHNDAEVLNADFHMNSIFVQIAGSGGSRLLFRKSDGTWDEVTGVVGSREKLVGSGVIDDKVYLLIEKDSSPYDLYVSYIKSDGFHSIPKLVNEDVKNSAITQVQFVKTLKGLPTFYYARTVNAHLQRYITIDAEQDLISDSILNPLGSSIYYHNSDRMEMIQPARIDDKTLKGSWIYGRGKPLVVNDIRFKVKPSNEVVTWLEHTGGVTVTHGQFGGYDMTVTSKENEGQLVGYNVTEKHNEVLVTVQRDNVDDDVAITKILGGIS